MATRIPITKDSGGLGFEDRQKRVWEDMEADLQRRRQDWEGEIENMRKEFFLLHPEAGKAPGGDGVGGRLVNPLAASMAQDRATIRNRLLESGIPADDSRGIIAKDEKGNPVFKVQFDVRDYRPDEVSVKMDEQKIRVSARQQTSRDGASVSREFNREVRIPNQLDPITLQCHMEPDGMLTVQAPIPAPSYAAVEESLSWPAVSTSSPAVPAAGGSAPWQESSSSSSSRSFQVSEQPPRPDPLLPSGYKPISAHFQNPSADTISAPAVPAPASAHQPHYMPSASRLAPFQPVPAHFQHPPADFFSHPPLHPPVAPHQPHFVSSVSRPPFQPDGNFTNVSGTSFKSHAVSGSGLPKQGEAGGRIGSPVLAADPSKFKLEIDIEDFKPEELTVKTQDKRVLVCARREEKIGTRSSTRELSREHIIPDTVDPLAIKAYFTDGGKLIVEAPYREDASPNQLTSS